MSLLRRKAGPLTVIIDELLAKIIKYRTSYHLRCLSIHPFQPKLTCLSISHLLHAPRQDHYSIFAELVSREQYPVYWQTIAQPTAISVMREKNEQGIFRNLDEFKVCRVS